MDKLNFDCEAIAVIALFGICAIAILAGMDGAKEVALALGGGVAGYLGGKAKSTPNTP